MNPERLQEWLDEVSYSSVTLVRGESGKYYLEFLFGKYEVIYVPLKRATKAECLIAIEAKNASYDEVPPTCPRVERALKDLSVKRTSYDRAAGRVKTHGTMVLRQAHVTALADLARSKRKNKKVK